MSTWRRLRDGFWWLIGGLVLVHTDIDIHLVMSNVGSAIGQLDLMIAIAVKREGPAAAPPSQVADGNAEESVFGHVYRVPRDW